MAFSPHFYACNFRPNVLLGVTNPFFIKTFQSWPHIMCLGELKMSSKWCFLWNSLWNQTHFLLHKFDHPLILGDLLKQVKVKKLTKLKTLDTKPGASKCIHLFFITKGIMTTYCMINICPYMCPSYLCSTPS